MNPSPYPLTIYRGDTQRWRFTLWVDAGQTVPVDLAGVTVAAALRQLKALTPLACTVAANQIDVVLAAAVSQTLDVGQGGRWDLQLTYPSGDVSTVVCGDVQVRADVTGSSAAA